MSNLKHGQKLIITGDFNVEEKPFGNLRSVLIGGDSTFRRIRNTGRNIGVVESRTDHIQVSDIFKVDYTKEFNDLSDHALICAKFVFKGLKK